MPSEHAVPVHEPVMTTELVTVLGPNRGGQFLDCTIGAGGHARALLEAGAGRVLGLDRDREVLPLAEAALASWADQVELVHADYREIDVVLDQRHLGTVDGALADLGMSSIQLETAGRGFSFRRDEPLDMRMDRSAGLTAAELLHAASQETLADRIFEYGEERYARRIARAIVHTRERQPLTSTGQLATLVRRVVPRRRGQRIDPATRTFQALRIWVNQELEGLDTFLLTLCRRLRAGARLAVISFHSLEDRIVKRTFRELERGQDVAVRVLTKRPLRPGPAEVTRNPRARSAKLRAAERLA
ncbi:MAG: 16S rRNA (cytosine(1402)-N(4))-methyltransferase RsmH [Myxococcota bacterium]